MGVRVVKVEGLKELQHALSELPKATSTNVLKRALMKAGEPIANQARQMAPDDPTSGGFDLRKSIVVSQRLSRRQKKNTRKESQVEVYIGAGPLPQAHLQEFGAAHHGPQPFMRPAWDAGQKPALDSIKKSLWEEIDKARVRLAKKAQAMAMKT